MERTRHLLFRISLVVAQILAVCAALPAHGIASSPPTEVRPTYLYSLSDFSGAVRYSQAKLYVDCRHNEVYAYDGEAVRVFNPIGMEIYRFGENQELGWIVDMSTDEKGDIYTLSYFQVPEGSLTVTKYYLIRCNYRGEPKKRFPIAKLPEEFSSFAPEGMIYRDGRFVIVSLSQMKGVVTDKQGVFERGYDFGAMVLGKEMNRADYEFFGFTLDGEGNFFFTAPTLSKVFKVSPDGKVSAFGKAGGAPGFFGVISGIAVDRNGNIFVSDKLKSVVMAFDKNFQFITQFGGRGDRRESLFGPTGMVFDNTGRLYITQLRNQGVSVFSLNDK